MAIPQAKVSVTPVRESTFGGVTGARIEITNWNDVMKVLVKLDKDYVKQLRKNFRDVAKPVQAEIKKAIPSKSKPPLTNMKQVHFGRLAWGSNFGAGAKPSKSAIIQTPNTRARKYKNNAIAIARVVVQSPGTALVDMAGRRAGARGRKGLTPKYAYMYTIGGQKVPGERQHRVVPGAFQKALVQSAKYVKQRWASRFVWPAAEKALPAARKNIEAHVNAVNLRVTELLRIK